MSLAGAHQREIGWKLGEYRRMLAQCSDEELQDIYFHIDVLRYPERYRAVLDEIRSRGLQPVSGVEPELVPQDIPQWIHTLSALQHRPLLAAALSALLLLGYTALMTFLFCLPIYLLAVPFKALNQQGALFYLLSFRSLRSLQQASGEEREVEGGMPLPSLLASHWEWQHLSAQGHCR